MSCDSAKTRDGRSACRTAPASSKHKERESLKVAHGRRVTQRADVVSALSTKRAGCWLSFVPRIARIASQWLHSAVISTVIRGTPYCQGNKGHQRTLAGSRNVTMAASCMCCACTVHTHRGRTRLAWYNGIARAYSLPLSISLSRASPDIPLAHTAAPSPHASSGSDLRASNDHIASPTACVG